MPSDFYVPVPNKSLISAYTEWNGVNASREVAAEWTSRPVSRSGQGTHPVMSCVPVMSQAQHISSAGASVCTGVQGGGGEGGGLNKATFVPPHIRQRTDNHGGCPWSWLGLGTLPEGRGGRGPFSARKAFLSNMGSPQQSAVLRVSMCIH